jgi:hypothetical protein
LGTSFPEKEYGGLGVLDLADLNMCLVASWIKRYRLDNDKIWKQIIDYKYRVDEPSMFYCPTGGASPFGKGVMWAAKHYKDSGLLQQYLLLQPHFVAIKRNISTVSMFVVIGRAYCHGLVLT